VCLQHEYGILVAVPAACSGITAPSPDAVVTTLHTVLREPDADQRIVMEEIATLSDRLIVMSEHSAEILQEVFRVPDNKIDLIPHGPDYPSSIQFYKDCFVRKERWSCSRLVCCRRQSIENVIQALPRILSRHTMLSTWFRSNSSASQAGEVEQYRLYLQKLAIDLGVQANVIFHNRLSASGNG